MRAFGQALHYHFSGVARVVLGRNVADYDLRARLPTGQVEPNSNMTAAGSP